MRIKFFVVTLLIFVSNLTFASIKTVEIHFVEPKNNPGNLELTLYFMNGQQTFYDQFFGNGKRDYSYGYSDLILDTKKQAFIDTIPVGAGNKAICQLHNVDPTKEHLKLNIYYDITNKTCAILGN